MGDAQWHELQAAQKHRCAYCGKRCKGKLTQDHVTPLGPDGPHTLHNIVAVCASCNSRKGRRGPLSPVQPLLLTIAPARKKKAS
jgi:5-methylcytosine-specific restriction endonuclease McrA